MLPPARWFRCLVVLAVFVLRAPGAERPNVLFIISDDQRPDTIAALGNPHIQTPNLDRLVRQGTVLTRAIAAFPICHVSRAEILTGITAFRNGAGYGAKRRDPTLATWPGTLRDAGYRTILVGKWDSGGFPEAAGFSHQRAVFSAGGAPKGQDVLTHYVDYRGQPATGYRGYTLKDEHGKPQPEKGVGLTPGISARFADAAMEAIGAAGEEPFFLQLAFTTPHDPRLIPPGYEGRYDPAKLPLPGNFLPEHPFNHGNQGGRDELLLPVPRPPELVRAELAVYYATITYMDEQIGRVLEFLQARGKLDSTIIIFTSDQGLAMGSHGLMGKQNMYEHSIGAPLILRGPGIPAGTCCAAPCYLRDLFPTVCEMTGVQIPASVEAKSLAAAIRGAGEGPHEALIAYFTDTQRAIRKGDWKYIEYPQANRRQLFNLQQDPLELHDLSEDPAQQERRKNLREEMVAWLKAHGDPLQLR